MFELEVKFLEWISVDRLNGLLGQIAPGLRDARERAKKTASIDNLRLATQLEICAEIYQRMKQMLPGKDSIVLSQKERAISFQDALADFAEAAGSALGAHETIFRQHINNERNQLNAPVDYITQYYLSTYDIIYMSALLEERIPWQQGQFETIIMRAAATTLASRAIDSILQQRMKERPENADAATATIDSIKQEKAQLMQALNLSDTLKIFDNANINHEISLAQKAVERSNREAYDALMAHPIIHDPEKPVSTELSAANAQPYSIQPRPAAVEIPF